MRRNSLRRRALIAAALTILAVAGLPAAAADDGAALKVPRFVALHSDRINLRAGPGRQYPIEWVLTKKDMPVEVIAQFEHWRRIRAADGTIGWVQEHMVDGRRTVVVAKGAVRPIYREPDGQGEVARAEPGVLARLLECRGPMCRIETEALTGWIRRSDLWGVYSDEKVP